MSHSGTCDCGTVNYAIDAAALHVYACHCLNCQTRSGSAFAEHAMVEAAAFTCEGEVAAHSRPGDGIVFEEVVCARCHTRLFNRNSGLPGMIFLRAGTLVDSQRIEPMAHIWASRKQSWLTLPDDIPTFSESPTPEAFGAAIAAAEARRTALDLSKQSQRGPDV